MCSNRVKQMQLYCKHLKLDLFMQVADVLCVQFVREMDNYYIKWQEFTISQLTDVIINKSVYSFLAVEDYNFSRSISRLTRECGFS